jgi:hypothetical protein
MTERSPPSLMSVNDGRQTIGQMLRTARGYRAFDINDKETRQLQYRPGCRRCDLEIRAGPEGIAVKTCGICGQPWPCPTPVFCGTSRKLDAERRRGKKPADPRVERVRRLMDPAVSLDQMWSAFNATPGRAASSTVEALAFQLRAGVTALREPSALRRIAELNEGQAREIASRLGRERWGISKGGEMPPRVPPWEADEIATFLKVWRLGHGI